jgi:hypothetical protein
MSWLDDFFQDLESAGTGGKTSDEERIEKERKENLDRSYDEAKRREHNKYLGTTGDKVARIQVLEDLLAGTYGVNITPEEAQKFKLEIAQLKDEVSQDTQYQPDYYVPTTDYDVTGYDVVRPDDISGLQVAHLLEALYPDKFGVPKYADPTMQDPSEAARAQADLEALATAKKALGSIEDVYQQGGLTAIDRARLEDIRRRNQMQERASREAILSDLEQRGQAGSGVELASRLINEQGSAERQTQEALGVEALAEQRALQAMVDAGTLGRTLSQDEFNRQYLTGAATDEVNKFNTIGWREVEEDTRRQEDLYREWQRAILEGDVKAMRAIENWYAEESTRQNAYTASQLNEESQWGAQERNKGSMYNVGNQTAANLFNTQTALNQILGYNQLQGDLGKLTLGQGLSYDTLLSGQPTPDWGQAIRNTSELTKSILDLFGDPGDATGKAGEIMGGGGGGSSGSAGSAGVAGAIGKIATL